MNYLYPVMVSVAGHDQQATLAWLDYLETLPLVEAYLMIMPIYARPGDESQYALAEFIRANLPQATSQRDFLEQSW